MATVRLASSCQVGHHGDTVTAWMQLTAANQVSKTATTVPIGPVSVVAAADQLVVGFIRQLRCRWIGLGVQGVRLLPDTTTAATTATTGNWRFERIKH